MKTKQCSKCTEAKDHAIFSRALRLYVKDNFHNDDIMEQIINCIERAEKHFSK